MGLITLENNAASMLNMSFRKLDMKTESSGEREMYIVCVLYPRNNLLEDPCSELLIFMLLSE